jgi:hypothetical protein
MAATVRSSALAIDVEGLAPLLRAFNNYGREANAELRTASRKVAQYAVDGAQTRGASIGRQAALAATSLRTTSDRVPALIYGGAKRVGKRKTPVGTLIFGAEFGGRGQPTTQQFLPHRGRDGYFLFPTLRAQGHAATAVWLAALDDLGARWAAGG